MQIFAQKRCGGWLFSLITLFTAMPAWGQSGSGLILEPFPKEQRLDAWADGYVLEKGHTQANDESLRLSIFETQGKIRLNPGNVESPRVGWDVAYLNLSTHDDALPDKLIDQSVGFATPIGKSGDWVFAAGAGIGYAGDGAYGDGDAWYGKGTLVAFKQPNEDTALIFVLDYNRNRTFLPDVPLPGFAYTKRVDDRLFYTFGLPVSSITWTPEGANGRWSLEATYTMPYTFDASISYEVANNFSVYGVFRNRYEAFFIDGLEQNYHRIFFEQRRAELGVRWEPKEGLELNAGVGYAWGGEFSTGFDSRDTDEITDISDEPYLKVGISYEF